MSKVFVVQSEQGHYFSKQGAWLSGKDAGLIYFGKYKDEALNQLIDITIKDVDVRARVLEVELNQRNQPVVEIRVQHDLEDLENISSEAGDIDLNAKQHALSA